MLKRLMTSLLSKFYSKEESASVAHQAFPSMAHVDFETVDPRVIKIGLDTTETTDENSTAKAVFSDFIETAPARGLNCF